MFSFPHLGLTVATTRTLAAIALVQASELRDRARRLSRRHVVVDLGQPHPFKERQKTTRYSAIAGTSHGGEWGDRKMTAAKATQGSVPESATVNPINKACITTGVRRKAREGRSAE